MQHSQATRKKKTLAWWLRNQIWKCVTIYFCENKITQQLVLLGDKFSTLIPGANFLFDAQMHDE